MIGALKIEDHIFEILKYTDSTNEISIRPRSEESSIFIKNLNKIYRDPNTAVKSIYVKDGKALIFKCYNILFYNLMVTDIDYEGNEIVAVHLCFDHHEKFVYDEVVHFTKEEMVYIKSLKTVSKFNL